MKPLPPTTFPATQRNSLFSTNLEVEISASPFDPLLPPSILCISFQSRKLRLPLRSSADECRYVIFDFDFITDQNCHKSKIFFIAW
ncbi:hypothetical protein I3842_14G097000 [Carya illinoinensis]|uniref:ADF-H domain-containing protein n=1 Tax=Carya illinoinensis TaxID=32201 RepID=A0A922AH34_CARIL|nr:hypothetical protein I3842_14G097000 [Carya illinoinensis]